VALAKPGARRGAASDLLVVGLANPGTQYAGTRHNIGADALRELVTRLNGSFSVEKRQRAESATVTTALGRITFAVPTTFMNESGAALPPLCDRFSISEASRIVIVHDELDLEPGRRQLKFGGGLAGHNGLRSIAGVLSTHDFWRLRLGVGKPPSKEHGADWVLKKLTGAAREALRLDIVMGADALERVVTAGPQNAQAAINGAS
jgi:PTH1 family peptidyl-tRNA hydrolase